MFRKKEYSSFLNICTKNKFTISLVYKFYIPNCCLFAGTDKERLCVSKTVMNVEDVLYNLTWSVPTELYNIQ